MRPSQICFLIAAAVVASAQAPAPPEGNTTDPAVVCKLTPDTPQCLRYLGATSGAEQRPGPSESTTSGRNNARYAIFLHTGGGEATLADRLGKALATKGFSVRGVDTKIDSVGGPGVDYFNEQDRQGARDIAEIVNALLPPNQTKLGPRFQRVSNPPGFLGIWLYGREATEIDPKTWSARVPSLAFCYQQNRALPGPGNYLVHCHYSMDRCEKVRGDKSEQKTDCQKINLVGADWQPNPGGFMDAWYQFSATPFGPPFPQFAAAPTQ
jgi:hypothetical protein